MMSTATSIRCEAGLWKMPDALRGSIGQLADDALAGSEQSADTRDVASHAGVG